MFTYVGTNQSSGGYYQRLHEYFVENIDFPTSRSQIAISNRWLSIQKVVNKFCGFFLLLKGGMRVEKQNRTE